MDTFLLIVAVLAVAGAGLAWSIAAAARRAVERGVASTEAELRRLADAEVHRGAASVDVRRELSEVRSAFEALRAREQERREREDQAWGVLHRVSSVLAGSQRAGRAGENVLSDALGHLPPSMLVRDFRVNGRVVEFGLVLPDGRRLPIDSKWPAERELLALEESRDADERERLMRMVERVVAERAKEVAGYLDPALTSPLAVAAVPDAAYAILRRAHADAYRQGVIVIAYSMALPVILFLHGLASRLGSVGDMQACLASLGSILDAVESTLENKVARAATMLTNGADELRGQLGKARSAVAAARASDLPAPDEVDAIPATVVRLAP